MKTLMVTALAVAATAAAAVAQTAPDLKGTWSGTFKTVIYGHNPHHPGAESVTAPPRVREIGFTLEVEGQDGRVLWGKSWSDPQRKEPFAATVGTTREP